MDKPVDLESLSVIEQAATPAPWAYTEGTGAQVAVGFVLDDEPGTTRLDKGGFFLFEIEPWVYVREEEEENEEKNEAQACADVRFIAIARNVLPRLITELREHRERERWIPCSERMPEAEERVLVHSPLVGHPFEAFQMPDFHPSHRWQFRNGSYCSEDEVTHWRPMPAPPPPPKDTP